MTLRNLLLLFAFLVTISSCYHYRLYSVIPEPENSLSEKETYSENVEFLIGNGTFIEFVADYCQIKMELKARLAQHFTSDKKRCEPIPFYRQLGFASESGFNDFALKPLLKYTIALKKELIHNQLDYNLTDQYQAKIIVAKELNCPTDVIDRMQISYYKFLNESEDLMASAPVSR